jgi:hypothetical protein
MSKLLRPFIIRALATLFVYAAVRVTSYLDSPRPYLWWHAALDLTVCVLFLTPGFLAWRRINR